MRAAACPVHHLPPDPIGHATEQSSAMAFPIVQSERQPVVLDPQAAPRRSDAYDEIAALLCAGAPQVCPHL